VLQPEYHACAKLLEKLAGGPFATLPIQARQNLLARNGLVPGEARENPDDEAAREVRTFVVPDLIAAYYRSPLGWAAVGYMAAFPGRCAGLTEYTRAPT